MNTVAAVTGLLLAAPDPLVAEVVVGHRANLERMRTLSAVYTVRSFQDGEKVSDHTLRYLRDLDGVLVREGAEGKSLTEHALLGGEVRRLTRVWPAKSSGGVRAVASRVRDITSSPRYDLWQTLCGAFSGNDLRPHDLAAVLAESDPPAAAVRDTRDGVPLVRVTRHGKPVKGTAYRADLWFDPAHGYALCRVESAGDGRSLKELSDVKEIAAGVWLPTRCVSDARASHGHYRSETVVTEVTANRPLPGGGTALPLPAGTEVKDELRGTEYKGNPDWTPAGPEKKWQPLRVAPPPDPGPYTGPTRDEPTGGPRRLLYVAAAVLLVGLGGLAAHKLLARRAGGVA